MKKKICFIAWERFSYGGISRVLSDIINGLCDDYEITILCLKNAQSLENVYGINLGKVEIIHWEMSFLQKLRREFVDGYLCLLLRKLSFWGVKNYVRLKYSSAFRRKIVSIIDHHFDFVIGASGLDESYLLASIAPHIGGVKIGWMHTSFEGYFLSGSSDRKEYALKRGDFYLSRLDKLIVLSNTDEKKYARFCHSVGVYNPVSFSSEVKADVNTRSFVFVGALSWVKGADILIDAFVLFAQENKDWRLDIYGDGNMWKYITDKIKGCNLEKRVSLNHSILDVKSAYLKAAALLFPSRVEGFGIVQGEAMTCGLPVLARALPITRELVEDHDCGFLYKKDSSEELCSIMKQYAESSVGRKKELQLNALRRANHFQINSILSTWNTKIIN